MASPPPHDAISAATHLFAEEAWFCIAVLLFTIGIFHWGSVLYSRVLGHLRPRRSVDEESTHTFTPGAARWSLSRLPIAAINVFRVVAFRWTLEFGTYDIKVADIFLALAYITLLLALTFAPLKEVHTISIPTIIHLGGRVGNIAASQFPLVTVLGTKNNIISLITGVGYDKLNYMHRVTARSCFALLLIHAGCEIYSFSVAFSRMVENTWLRLGIAAVISLAILFVVSLRAIRTRAYEIFFYTHFVTVLVFLIAAYFHTRAHGASFWIWPSFMFWGIDRLMRFVRVVFYNHLYFGFGGWRAKLQDANTELLSDDFIRVRVHRPLHFQWTPGQTAYLIMPSVSKFPLEAHPFSISSVDSINFRTSTKGPVTNGSPVEDAGWKEIVFIINVRGGFTKRLKDVATQKQTVKVLIDGPYGSAPDMATYDTSIFVAGGSGVTYTLPVFLSVIEACRKGPASCRRVVFIWAVRDAGHIQWISDALRRANELTPSWLAVSIRIFATRSGTRSSESRQSLNQELASPDMKEGSSHEGMMTQSPPSVRVESGRPDLQAILKGEVSTATGSMSVTVCGSQSLTRSVRRALTFPVSGPSSVLSGGPSVTLHVESFGYA